jgi:type IV pilus assembly protein PilY1
VGGLNQGGKSFYALDITDPGSPSLLWEFTNANLGYSYSNPRITKLADGTWVVLVASGYNNADGVGRLFVIRARDGVLLNTITTGVGAAASPSGLTKLAARAPTSATNNTVEQVYGGDLLGNVWRFDVNGNLGALGTDAQLLTQLKDPGGAAQPITAKPSVGQVGTKPLVMVGTGRYLGLTDLTDTGTFTMYGIKDELDTTTLGTPRTNTTFVQQVMTDTTCPPDAPSTICTQGQVVRTSTNNTVDWTIKNGWYVDFVMAGERSVTDATLALGTLVFTTVKPQTSTGGTIVGCSGDDPGINAKSYLYYLNYLTGGPVEGTKNVVGEELCTCIATRPSVVKTQSGSVEGIIRMSGGGSSTGTDMGVTSRQDLPYSGGGGASRRISWRELNGD